MANNKKSLPTSQTKDITTRSGVNRKAARAKETKDKITLRRKLKEAKRAVRLYIPCTGYHNPLVKCNDPECLYSPTMDSGYPTGLIPCTSPHNNLLVPCDDPGCQSTQSPQLIPCTIPHSPWIPCNDPRCLYSQTIASPYYSPLSGTRITSGFGESLRREENNVSPMFNSPQSSGTRTASGFGSTSRREDSLPPNFSSPPSSGTRTTSDYGGTSRR